MRRGRTARGRERRQIVGASFLATRRRREPGLLSLGDQGETATLTHDMVGASDPFAWTDAFLAANRAELQRVSVTASVHVQRREAALVLTSGEKIGAVPLRSPVTRKVSAGLLVKPRYGWPSVGRVLSDVGFKVEPEVGGLALVPGSAREVPPWVLAGPVVARVAAVIERLSRAFVPVEDERASPRGRVDWNDYARRAVPTGRWTAFRCAYSELADNPDLAAALRWTLTRVGDDLSTVADLVVVRQLLDRIGDLLRRLGPGPSRRPSRHVLEPMAILSEWLLLALEAVAWVRDERGLGGATALDGLPWSLTVSAMWEAWVESFLVALAARLGGRLSSARQGATRRPIVWQSGVRSLGHLSPDFLLVLPGRSVWVDAKYKDHLNRLRSTEWGGLESVIRESHRADFHQALAYALLARTPRVDTILVYPEREGTDEPAFATASMTAGDRDVRLVMGSLPFGFAAPARREAALDRWERVLRA